MSQFVVGQWVECVDNNGAEGCLKLGSFYRVTDVIADEHFAWVDGIAFEFAANRFRPVEWQVGRTYKTTLEGVTATITRVAGTVIYGHHYKSSDQRWWKTKTGTLGECKLPEDVPHLTPYLVEPSPAAETTEPSKPAESQPTPSRYHRTINGATLDLYDIAEAYGIDSHRIFHAVKKLILAGRRGHKDREQDLREAIVSIESELQKMKGGGA